MASRDADERRPHFEPGEALGGIDRVGHRLDRPVDVDDDALPQPIRGRLADADDVDAAALGDLADEHADLRRTNVDGDEHRLLSHDSPRTWNSPHQPSAIVH